MVFSAVGNVASSAISADAATSAANTASEAQKYAAALAQQRYETTRGDLMPYNQYGQNAAGQLGQVLSDTNTNLNSQFGQSLDAYNYAKSMMPGTMTQDELERTPGYQFNLGQGLKAVQASAAAKGLGVSSPAMQAAANYATGLADSTYQNQFSNQQTKFADANNLFTNSGNLFNMRAAQGDSIYNKLSTQASLGENAAAQTGYTGASLASTQANMLNNAAGTQAAGATAAANAWGKGFSNIANNYNQSNALGASGYSTNQGSANDGSYYGFGQGNTPYNNYLAGAYNDATGEYSNIGGGVSEAGSGALGWLGL